MKLFSQIQRHPLVSIIAIVILIAISFASYTILRSTKPTALSDVAHLTSGIRYCNDNNPARTFDLYRPKNVGDKPLPLIVYIHGGGWRWGDENNHLLNTYAPRFIAKGFAVATLDYRLNPKNPYPDQNNDIACALAYIDTNANALKIDINKTIYFGDSAGGQLAAFAALNIPFANYDYEAPLGVIDFYGVSDFSTIVDGVNADLNARRYLGSKYNKTAIAASPTTYITKKAPRFLFFHGTSDKVVPIAQSRSFYDSLTKIGVDAEYISISGAGHAFAGPELPQAQNKLISDNINTFLDELVVK